MSRVIFDLEADGLKPTLIWCIATKDIDTQEERFFGPDEIAKGVDYLSSCDLLIGHNIVEFDLPVLRRLQGLTVPSTGFYDTLVVSRLLHPDRPLPQHPDCKSAPHSLKAWGYRLGLGKPEHEDWSQFSPEMKVRCITDVRINEMVYHALQAEAGEGNWNEAIELEMQVARIIYKQAEDGVYFDIDAAKAGVLDLQSKIDAISDELSPLLPTKVKQYGSPITQPFRKNGTVLKRVDDWFEGIEDDTTVGGPFTRIIFEPFNLNSDVQVKQLLLSLGWKPISWNYNSFGERSSPKLEFSEKDTDGLDEGIGSLLKSRRLWCHRKSQIEGWIKHVREDQTLPAGANPCGTNTGRMRHRLVVNVPKAAEYVPYGHEMRSYFRSRPDRLLVGYDAAGLELRMLAHFMNDKDYIEAVVNGTEERGTDVHTLNQKLAGLPTRDAAKTFIYAFNYGAGDAKLGAIAGGDAREGLELRRRFLRANPALEQLIKGVKRASSRTFLLGLDGRKLYMRSSPEGRVQTNKALNTLLQGSGAIVMKKAMMLLDSWITEEQLDVIKVIDMHDESQADVAEKDVARYVELAELAMVKAGEHFNLNLPLKATCKVGNNWAETH